jgi:hypothetical protein
MTVQWWWCVSFIFKILLTINLQANEDAMEKLKLAKQSHEQFVKKKDG